MKSLKEKRSKKNTRTKQIVVGLVLVVVMLLSTLGYAFQGTTQKKSKDVVYGDYTFVGVGGNWNLKGTNLYFNYNPSETPDLNLSFPDYNQKEVYLDIKNFEIKSEVTNILSYVALRVQDACLEGEECLENVPIKDCTNNLIIVREGENSYLDKNCVFIQSSEEDLMKTVDGFLFKLLGIKQ